MTPSRIGFAAVAALVVAAALAVGAVMGRDEPVRCADFRTQHEAQESLERHPQLDRDRDGIPCEALP